MINGYNNNKKERCIMAIEEKKLKGKAPFKERWQSFKKAYLAWAQYNQFKEDPFPDWNTVGLEEIRKLPPARNSTEYVIRCSKAGAISDYMYKRAWKERRVRVKTKKSTLRKNLKQAFLKLF